VPSLTENRRPVKDKFGRYDIPAQGGYVGVEHSYPP
jgi:hypothetical protein